MHLNILSKWINPRKKTKALLLSTALGWMVCLICCTEISAEQAASNVPVTVTVLSQKEVYFTNISVRTEIQFNDMSYYNERTYLSYHIYKGTYNDGLAHDNDIAYENQRLQIKPDSNGRCVMELEIALSEEAGNEQYIMFDIVDEQNAYWMSLTEPLVMQTEGIIYKNDPVKAFFSPLITAVAAQPLQLAVNAIVLVISVGLIIIVWKRRLLSFKKNDKKQIVPPNLNKQIL